MAHVPLFQLLQAVHILVFVVIHFSFSSAFRWNQFWNRECFSPATSLVRGLIKAINNFFYQLGEGDSELENNKINQKKS